MWRYYWMWKKTVEDYSKLLTIKWLKNFLKDKKENLSGTYAWTTNWKETWSMWVEMYKWKTNLYIRLQFIQTSSDWDKKKLDYKIQLVSTPCNYWWIRWWFECPCKWNKCSILYLQNNWIFASRKTLDLCYEEQKDSKRKRYISFIMWDAFTKIELIKRTMKYPFRNWKPTKKMKRILELRKKMPTMNDVNNMKSVLWW
jgi:hypothetical protein